MSNNKKPKIYLLQLTPHSKRLFLEHSIKKCLQNEDSKFNKFMIISKAYIFTCQSLIKIFIGNLPYGAGKNFVIRFMPFYKFYGNLRYCQRMLFGDILKLQKLVKFKYCEIRYDAKCKEEYERILTEMKDARVSLYIQLVCINENVEKELEEKFLLIQHLKNRLYQLECSVNGLLDSRVSSLNLEKCVGKNWTDFDQVREILTKHTIKKLCLYNNFRDANFGFFNFDSFPYCPKLNKLSLSLYQNRDIVFFDSIIKALNYMSNLKKLKISFNFEYDGDDAKLFQKLFFETLEKMREIQNKYGNLQKIKFEGQFDAILPNYKEVFYQIINKLRHTIPNYNKEYDVIKNCISKNDYEVPCSRNLDNFTWKDTNINFEIKINVTTDNDQFSDEEEENIEE